METGAARTVVADVEQGVSMGRSVRVRTEAHASTTIHRTRWTLALATVVVAVTATVGQASGAAASSTAARHVTRTAEPAVHTAVPMPLRTAAALPRAATAPSTPLPPAAVAVAAPAGTPCRKGVVALTFDDGPAKVVTERLLGILTKHHVPATFFEVGTRVSTAPDVARAVQKAGFQIGNHTWDHAALTSLKKKGIRAELTKTAEQFRKAGVTPAPLMRPPYGAVDGRVRKIAKKMGLVPVLWTVDSNDWRGKHRKGIIRGVLAQLRPHQANVVLQHDGVTNSPASVAAVPTIIAKARHRGYCFGTIGADGRPHPPVPVLLAQVTGGAETGPTPATISLTLSEPTSRPVSVHLTTVPGTATPGTDFAPVDVTVTFLVGAQAATVSVPVVDDFLLEGTETFSVELSAGAGLTVSSRTVPVPIADDD
ncbi:MAG: polysaccharide deacetylase [Nocardioidaceae bacterium]|nr:polysaccharide deacetylase [Nocardioidaceae bacterium]